MGYFDLLTRYAVETADWDTAAKIPLLVPSRDFVAVKLQLETMAAAAHRDAAVAKLAAGKLVLLAQEPGPHPFAQQIITIQAKEAEAVAAKAAGSAEEAIAKMKKQSPTKIRLTAFHSLPIRSFPRTSSLAHCSWS